MKKMGKELTARDWRQEITSEIIRLMEEKRLPWQKPWNENEAARALARPQNAVTGRPYHGVNTLVLMANQYARKSLDPRWCTFKQASDNGWKIKKGEHAKVVRYWKFGEEKTLENQTTGEKEKVFIEYEVPRVFFARVFHASQIEGIPEYKKEVKEKWSPIEKAEEILKNSGARIFHDQSDHAFYAPKKDEIHLPPKESFAKESGYYSTALHELGHWTGHASRLNRALGNSFGTPDYAKEELRAEMASLYLSIETGVPFDPSQHAAYEKSWLEVLKNDKNEFFRACSDAEKITEYVMELGLKKEKGQKTEKEVQIPEQRQTEKTQPGETAEPHAAPEQKQDALAAEPLADLQKTIAEKLETGVPYYPIDEAAAKRAKEAMSFSDYKPGSATAEYRRYVDEAAEIAARQKKRVDPSSHAKIDGLLDAYARKLAANMNKGYEIAGRVPSVMIVGGSNFPVRKKEKQNAAADKNMEEFGEIQGLLDKIRSAGMGGIRADDPNAVSKLENKLEKLTQLQETMKAVNAYYRKNKTLDGCPNLTAEQIEEMKASMPGSWRSGSKIFESYQLSNNNAEIRRLKERIASLIQRKEIGYAGWEFDGGRVKANEQDNRLQIFFDEKPDADTRKTLKSYGFKWAPSAKAWQRQLNDNAIHAADRIGRIAPLTGESPAQVQKRARQEAAAQKEAPERQSEEQREKPTPDVKNAETKNTDVSIANFWGEDKVEINEKLPLQNGGASPQEKETTSDWLEKQNVPDWLKALGDQMAMNVQWSLPLDRVMLEEFPRADTVYYACLKDAIDRNPKITLAQANEQVVHVLLQKRQKGAGIGSIQHALLYSPGIRELSEYKQREAANQIIVRAMLRGKWPIKEIREDLLRAPGIRELPNVYKQKEAANQMIKAVQKELCNDKEHKERELSR